MADRDWSNLPTDLLIVFFQCLEIPVLLRSSAVCRSWHSAADELRRLRLPSRKTPWLLTCTEGRGDPFNADFYSLSENKTYTVSLPHPPIRRRFCIGSSHGWLITADDKSDLHLLNPITGAQIDLPRVSTFQPIKATFRPNGEVKKYKLHYPNSGDFFARYNPEGLRYEFYERASLSSSPSEGSNYIVMVIHGPDNNLSFARAGERKWTMLPVKAHLAGFSSDYFHCLYYKGVLLAVTTIGTVDVWDISGVIPEVKDVMPRPKEIPGFTIFKYFVQTPWGDLLEVWRLRSGNWREIGIYKTLSIKVYKMDFDGRRNIEVSNLGDYLIILGCSDPLFLSSKDFPMLRSNCIYFIEDDFDVAWCQKNGRYDISIYDMEDGSCEPILPDPLIFVTPTLV